MSTREQFFPKSGPWVTNPKHLGSFYGTDATIKSGAGTTVDTATDSFFTAQVVKQGAYATIAANDTYVTICDITGGGFLSAIIGAAAGNNNDISTLEVTVDGVVTTITMTLPDASYRQYIGLITPAVSLTAGHSQGPNSGNDLAINMTTPTTITVPNFVWPQTARAFGMPGLRFNSALKIRAKITTKHATTVYQRCAALYVLDAA